MLTHARCGGIAREEYLRLLTLDDYSWICHICILAELPFADASLNSDDNTSADINVGTSRSSRSSDTSLDTSVDPLNNSSKHLSCYLYSARSVMNKLGDLTALREADKPDIIAITESLLDDVIGDSEISDSSYCVFRRDLNRHGGGVMLLIKSTICATRRADLEGDCELLWIEISHSRGVYLLGVFYRSPISSSEYLYNLQNSLAKIPDSQTIILCGDFNVPDVDWDLNVPTTSSSLAKLLYDITFNFSLFQLVTDATRNSNMLDLVFVNYSE